MFLLIDTNNYFSRFYFANTEKVIDLYLNFFKKALNFFSATHYCNVIDAERSFRYDIYDQYKSTREEKPEDYHEFFKLLKFNFEKLKIHSISSKTLEAEDSCNLFVKNNLNQKFTILSGDKDCLLTLDSPNVEVWDYKATEFVKRNFVKYNIFEKNNKDCAESFLLYLSLKGDSSDNIPGVPGYGEKKVEYIIEKYKTIENLYSHFEKPTIFDKCDKNFVNLLQYKENIKISEKLVRLYNREWKVNLEKYANKYNSF